MRKEYLVLKSDRVGEADIVGVFSSRKKAKRAVEKDSDMTERNHSYWLVILPEDRPARGLKTDMYGKLH